MPKQRILFLYPNERDMSLVPPVIGLFSQMLKQQGHKVALFDSTGYVYEGKNNPDIERENNLFFKPSSMLPTELENNYGDLFNDFEAKVETFKPTLIAVTMTESTFLKGIALLDHLRDNCKINITTIAGGVFPTFAPERVIRESAIDIVCVGEGEIALSKLCERLEKGNDYDDISNLWVKNKIKKNIKRNSPGPAIDIDNLPTLDFGLFDPNRFVRPMRGKLYRMLPIETHRGCPYRCTFCNSPSQNALYKEQTNSNFFRKKSVEKIREEIINFRDKWNGEYVFFWADTFLAWEKRELEEFCEMYSEFNFPFWCQSRPETVSNMAGGKEKLTLLKKVGLHHMSFGLEHGNAEFRKKVAGRSYSNELAIESLNIPAKLDIPFTINNIIGFPDETYELAMETVELNRQIPSFNLSCSTFSPYVGTELRKLSEQKGYVSPQLIAPANVDTSTLDMPNFTKDKIKGLQRTFNMYVKFPKSRWWEIKKAESLTPEGDIVWGNLKQEFLETYFHEAEPRIDKNND